jgi:hypothetical protein
MENYTSGTGQQLKVHDRDVCQALKRGLGTCIIHARQDTHMKEWPTHWRSDWGGFFEVICPHGIGHPAPEQVGSAGLGHGCDGCCVVDYAAPPPGTFRYSQGGLMRCCIKTLTDVAREGDDHIEGSELACRWCQTRMILADGVWKWDKSRSWYTPEAKEAA